MKTFLELVDASGKPLSINIDAIKAIRASQTNAYLTEIFCDFTREPFVVKKSAIDIIKKLTEVDFHFIK